MGLSQTSLVIACLSLASQMALPTTGGAPPAGQGRAEGHAHFPPRQPKTDPPRVYPGMHQFPEREVLYKLVDSLDCKVIGAMQVPDYYNVTMTHNIRTMGLPFAHVMVESLQDVQKVLLFAKKYNLMVVIRSSGHSFIGRSGHDGGIVINLTKMKGLKFDLSSIRSQAGEVTVQSGNSWLDVYKAVDQQVTYDDVGNPQRRVIVGGSAHTVAMGGYTQGGGHSPICRQLGLAVDSLLEATIVLADGRKAVVNEQGTSLTELDGATSHSNDTSLFWAIRGGGGGTWGVVTDFTFKLHYAPARFRNVALAWALTYKGQDIGSGTLRFVVQQLSRLSQQWGGYLIVSGAPLSAEAKGSVSLFLNHFGSDDDASNHDVDALLAHNPYQNQYLKKDLTFPTFLGYEQTVYDPAYYYLYTFDNFIQPSLVHNATKLQELVAFFMTFIHPPSNDSYLSCTGTLTGGKMREVADGVTPVNPKFRSGLLALTCSLAWPASTTRDPFFVGNAMLMRDILAKLGEGSYFNEPAEDLEDWKVQFWGDASNYNRLLDAKRKWDPDNFFWCHNCVGSDNVTSGADRSDH